MKGTLLLLLSLATIGAVSCKKKSQCSGGSGGSLTLVLFPQHHGKAIISQAGYRDTAYIKYNAVDAPASGTYDQVLVGEEGEEHVHVTGLKCGNYYVYMTGFDTSIGERVKGGIPVTASQSIGELDINVPVSE